MIFSCPLGQQQAGVGVVNGGWGYVLSLSLLRCPPLPTRLIDVPFIDALDWFLPFYLDRQTDAGDCVCVCVCRSLVQYVRMPDATHTHTHTTVMIFITRTGSTQTPPAPSHA